MLRNTFFKVVIKLLFYGCNNILKIVKILEEPLLFIGVHLFQ